MSELAKNAGDKVGGKAGIKTRIKKAYTETQSTNKQNRLKGNRESRFLKVGSTSYPTSARTECPEPNNKAAKKAKAPKMSKISKSKGKGIPIDPPAPKGKGKGLPIEPPAPKGKGKGGEFMVPMPVPVPEPPFMEAAEAPAPSPKGKGTAPVEPGSTPASKRKGKNADSTPASKSKGKDSGSAAPKRSVKGMGMMGNKEL
jgi:hypothetical protein